MSRVNTTPKTLQDLLGNTAAGINPSELLNDVRPTTDLFPLWAIDKQDYVTFNGQIAAVFQQQTIRVPRGEVWIPMFMSADITSNGFNEEFRLVVGVADEANLQRVKLGWSPDYGVTDTTQETTTANYAWSSIQPVKSDEFFFVQAHKFVAGAARSVGMNLKFIRLRA